MSKTWQKESGLKEKLSLDFFQNRKNFWPKKMGNRWKKTTKERGRRTKGLTHLPTLHDELAPVCAVLVQKVQLLPGQLHGALPRRQLLLDGPDLLRGQGGRSPGSRARGVQGLGGSLKPP